MAPEEKVEVTQPPHPPSILHIIVPPIAGPLTDVEGQIVPIDTIQLPTPEEVQASASSTASAAPTASGPSTSTSAPEARGERGHRR
jgi:hypothetical protein